MNDFHGPITSANYAERYSRQSVPWGSLGPSFLNPLLYKYITLESNLIPITVPPFGMDWVLIYVRNYKNCKTEQLGLFCKPIAR